MKKLLLSFLGLMAIAFLFAQPMNQLTIQGQITDDSTGAPIANHMVLITSDTTGNGGPGMGYFALEMTGPNGNYSHIVPINAVNAPVLMVITMDCQQIPQIAVVQVSAGVQTVDFSICGGMMPPPPMCQADFIANPVGPQNMFKWKFMSMSMPQNAQHSWTFGDGNTSAQPNPMHTYAAPGLYNVCLSIADSIGNCTDSFCMTILVDSMNVPPPPTCQADFTANPVGPANNFNWKFNSFSTPQYAQHSWDFGDGNTSSQHSPMHTYANPGLFNVCLTISDSLSNCTSSFCMMILVDTMNVPPPPTCQADFFAFPGGNNGTASPFTWNFHSLSSPPYAMHSWSFGDGNTSTMKNPSHTYSQPGLYNVCLSIYDSISMCSDSFCIPVLVDTMIMPPMCQADFDAWPMPNDPAQWKFMSFSTPPGAMHSWDFGDGNTTAQKNPMHTYASPGLYNVCLTITDSLNGCTDSYCMSILVDSIGNNPTCFADFTAWPLNFMNTDTWKFQSLSIPMNAQHSWSFGDGSTSNTKNPVHTYANPGIYNVCLTISDSLGNCNDTWCMDVIVDSMITPPACFADFDAWPLPNGSGQWKFLSLATPPFANHYWDFGDGNTSTMKNPMHTYASPGMYNVCLTIADSINACNDSYCLTILVDTMPGGPAGPGGGMMCDADFSFQVDSTGNTVQFFDQSMPLPDFWMWNFGDGNSSIDQNPVHTYAATGTYQVSLVIGFLNCICFDTASMTIGSPVSIVITGTEAPVQNELAGLPYPNPVNDELNLDISLESSSEAVIQLTDITGKQVWSEARFIEQGAQTIKINTAELNHGIYLLSLELEGGERIVRKISK